MAGYTKSKKDPQEDIRQLNTVIEAKAFKNVHLLCGDEDYLRLQFRDRLVKACGGEAGSMSYDRFIGKDTVPERIIDLAETMPFFSDRRVILIEDTDWFKNSCDPLTEYIKQGVCESTCIIFCEKNIDKTKKLYKAVAAAGMVSCFDRQTPETLRSWLLGQVKKAKLEMNAADAAYMISVVGTDMVVLSNELEKTICYCLERGRITRTDIDEMCTRLLEDRVFEMCDALALGKKTRAFDLYYDLIGLKSRPTGILVQISRQYELLLKIKDLELNRRSDSYIATHVGRPDWTIKNYRAQTSKYSLDELKRRLRLCVEAELMIKTGRMSEDVAVESLLVQLS